MSHSLSVCVWVCNNRERETIGTIKLRFRLTAEKSRPPLRLNDKKKNRKNVFLLMPHTKSPAVFCFFFIAVGKEHSFENSSSRTSALLFYTLVVMIDYQHLWLIISRQSQMCKNCWYTYVNAGTLSSRRSQLNESDCWPSFCFSCSSNCFNYSHHEMGNLYD